MRKAFGLVGGMLVMLTCLAPVRAQLPPGVKPIDVFTAGVDAAEKLVADGKKNEARFVLLGLAPIIQRAQGQLPGDLLPRYEKAMNALWEPLTEANQAAAGAAYKAANAEFEAELTRYAIALDLFTPKDSLSFEQYANFLLKAKECYPKAEACGVAYAAKAPSPVLYLKLATQTTAFQYLNYLQRILISDGLWQPFLEKNILPRSLQKAGEELARITDDSPVHAMLMAADKVREYVGYAKAIDPKQPQLADLSAKADALLKKAEAKIALQTAENRMPGDSYKGNDLEALRTQLMAAYRRAFPNEKPVKLTIRGDAWTETAEAWSEGDTIRSGIFRWLEAAVAVENEKAGEVRVFYVRFGRQWTGRADEFGEPYYSRTSLSYNMLKSNL
ncbi:MAG: hypothetical protein HZB16_17255 [Armatimonadetes bacterium]|nr:hypothetical protein [Armatimonadota bacterium]